jgi:hypothetical protein
MQKSHFDHLPPHIAACRLTGCWTSHSFAGRLIGLILQIESVLPEAMVVVTA